MIRVVLALAFLCGTAINAFSQENPEGGSGSGGFQLAPAGGQSVAGFGGFNANASEDGAVGTLSYFGPILQDQDGFFFVDAGASLGLDTDYNTTFGSAFLGLGRRERLTDDTVVGVNAYIDAGVREGSDTLFTLFGLGLELDHRRIFSETDFLQVGVNGYQPLHDYTNFRRYGVLSAAPRQGVDAYLSYGRTFDGLSLRGNLIGFHYTETSDAFDLTGYRTSIDAELWRGLPEGMVLTASVGLQDDSRAGVGIEPVFAVGLRFNLGSSAYEQAVAEHNSTMDTLRAKHARRQRERELEIQAAAREDCAVVRNPGEEAKLDCADRVVASADPSIIAKDGSTVRNDRAAPAVEPLEPLVLPPAPTRPVVVSRPRRHLGFGSPFTPIEYKPNSSLQLIKQANGGDDTFTFDGLQNNAFDVQISTTNGRGTSGRISVTPGTFSIRETNLPNGWTLSGASCTGVTNSRFNAATRTLTVTLANFENGVCTFTNTFSNTPPPPPPPAPPANLIIEVERLAPLTAINVGNGNNVVFQEAVGDSCTSTFETGDFTQVAFSGDVNINVPLVAQINGGGNGNNNGPVTADCIGTSASTQIPANTAVSFSSSAGSSAAIDVCSFYDSFTPGGVFPNVVLGGITGSSLCDQQSLERGVRAWTCTSTSGGVTSGASNPITTPPAPSGETVTCTVAHDAFAGVSVSDARLKTNIEALGVSVNGFPLYAFEYKPELGRPGRFVGVMAQDVLETRADAVVEYSFGYAVAYGRLGLRMATFDEWRSGGSAAVLVADAGLSK